LGSAIGPPTAVLFGATPAPLIYTGINQVNLVVPFEISGAEATQLRVLIGSQVIAELSLPVASASPALFTQTASGVGPGAILNQDSTINSPLNPAERGSIVSLFATGAGQTDPPGRNGELSAPPLPKPLLPISVQIGGLDAEILYAGAAPGLIAGVIQVNCRIPASLPPGPAVPVTLFAGSARSPAGVTLSVR